MKDSYNIDFANRTLSLVLNLIPVLGVNPLSSGFMLQNPDVVFDIQDMNF